MKTTEKQKAIKLRHQGMSIKDIAKSVSVAKSTVSLWVRDILLTKKQLTALSSKGVSKELIEKRRRTRITNENSKRERIMSLAGEGITTISKHELRLIGLCLYWGEGGKTNHGVARISNSDPLVIITMMRFFREICLAEEKKFRGHIHTYSHLDTDTAEAYWSKVSGIPRNQFYKTYVKRSTASKGKADKLPYGTFDIYVCSTKLFLEIMGQIQKLKKLIS